MPIIDGLKISNVAVELAARWLAQFLPSRGLAQSEFDKFIYKEKVQIPLNEFEKKPEASEYPKRHNPITKDQYELFIGILIKEISMNGRRSFDYIRIGDSQGYDSPECFSVAAKAIGIEPFFCFPWKTELRIYCSGQVQMGKNVYSTDSTYPHFDSILNFNSANYFKFFTHEFRWIEIDFSQLTKPLYYSADDGFFREWSAERLFGSAPPKTTLLCKVTLKTF